MFRSLGMRCASRCSASIAYLDRPVRVFIGLASGRWYLTENLQMLALNRALLGAVVNILANLLLIPEYGIVGAAMGTVLSQMAASYLFDFFTPRREILFG